MDKLINSSLVEFSDRVKSSDPTPGGGSVSAYLGMLGASLGSMMAGLTIGNKGYDELSEEVRKEMEENYERLKELCDELSLKVDEDTSAFDEVVVGFKMPKETEEEQKARNEQIQKGYKVAVEVPLSTAKKSLEVLDLVGVFVEFGNVNAVSDIGVSVLSAYSGLEGAIMNVLINFNSLKDEEYKASLQKDVDEILSRGKELRDKYMEKVHERL